MLPYSSLLPLLINRYMEQGVQVDPRNGDVYIIYTEDGWSTHYLNTNIYIANGVTGTQKEVIDYTGTYWFPSTIAFQ